MPARVAETTPPQVRGLALHEVVRAFGDTVKFRAISAPDEYSAVAKVGDEALRYRDHCWKPDPPGTRSLR